MSGLARAERAEVEVRSARTMRGLFLYFLRLGSFGFGGPIALAGYMRRDLVEARGWYSEDEYQQGLAIAQTVARAHGGDLWVSQNLDGAVVFTMMLMIRAGQEENGEGVNGQSAGS